MSSLAPDEHSVPRSCQARKNLDASAVRQNIGLVLGCVTAQRSPQASRGGREGETETQRERGREREREPSTTHDFTPLEALKLSTPQPLADFQDCDPGRRRWHAHPQQLVGLVQPSAEASFAGLNQIQICRVIDAMPQWW